LIEISITLLIANFYLGRIIRTTKTYSVLAAMSSPEKSLPRSIRLRELAKQIEAIPFIRDSILKTSKLGDILEVLNWYGCGSPENIFCRLSVSRSFEILPCNKSEAYNAKPLPIFENFKSSSPILFDSSSTLFLNPWMCYIRIQGFIEKMESSDRDKITKLALHYNLLFRRGDYARWYTLALISHFRNLTEVTAVSEKDSPVFPEGGFEKQPLDDIEFYTPPSTAPRNILPYAPLDCLMHLTDIFERHESWGKSSRKPDLKVVAIIRNGKMMGTDFPELPSGARKVETALIDGSSDFEEIFLEQDSEYEEGQDVSSLLRTNSLCSDEDFWHSQESKKSEDEAASEEREQNRPREEEVEEEV
jgi:hypothetical protein